MRVTVAVLAVSAIALAPLPVSHALPSHSGQAGPAAVSAKSTAPDLSKVKVPTLNWAPCEKKNVLLCATALVPLDYSKPDGPKIAVGMAKSPATGKKKGTVFINPGGPGASASAVVLEFASVLGEGVGKEYDVIGIDPRGIGSSSEATCWSNEKKPTEPTVKFPVTAEEQKLELAFDNYRRVSCGKTGRPIIDHMSTAQTARDMEMIRRAVGDKQLNYYGVSYGTHLGATYAALFPKTVGRMALDSVLDPVAYTTGREGNKSLPASARVGSGEGAQEALKAAFAECKKAGAQACPHGDVIEKAWHETLAALKKAPVTKGETTYTYHNMVADTASAMYSAPAYGKLMKAIHEAWQAVTVKKTPPTELKKAAEEARKETVVTPLVEQVAVQKELEKGRPSVMGYHSGAGSEVPLRAPSTSKPSASPEKPIDPAVPVPDRKAWTEKIGAQGVLCSDTVNPKDPQAWTKYAASPQTQANPFRSYWAWATSTCANWPGQDKNVYRGPFDVKPANPLLIMNNTHDPSTPMANAKSLNHLSPGSRLLTVHAWGHGSSFVSSCAQKALESFLLTGTMPKEGASCQADKPLFPGKR